MRFNPRFDGDPMRALLLKCLVTFGLAVMLAVPAQSWAAPSYYLKSPVPGVTNLGPPFSSAEQAGGKCMFDTADGKLHLVAGLNSTGGHDFTLLHVNITDGTWHVAPGASGRYGALTLSAFCTLNDNLYFMTMYAARDLYEFNPATGSLTCKQNVGAYAPLELAVGKDNKLYIGTYAGAPGGRVFQYDPASDTLVDMGVPGARSAETHITSICCDGTYIYCVIHQSQAGANPAHYYLAIIKLSDKSVSYKWDVDNDSYGVIGRTTTDKWAYRRTLSDGRTSGWELANGEVKSRTAWTNQAPKPGHQDHQTRAPRKLALGGEWSSIFHYECDFSDMVCWDGHPESVIRYRRSGVPVWTSKTIKFDRLPVYPVKPFRVLPINGANPLLVFGDGYFPAVKYDYQTRTVREYLGFPQVGPYSLLQADSGYYICGYPGMQVRYDPSLPWTLTGANFVSKGNDPGESHKTNPYRTKAQYGKWNHFSTYSRESTVWMAGPHRYTSNHSLIWYNPATGANGEIIQTVPCRSLVAADQRAKICWGGNGDQIFVYDAATKKLERTIKVNSGLATAGNVIMAPSNTEFVLAVVVDNQDRTGATKKLVKVNISDGTTVWSKAMPAGFPFGSPDQSQQNRQLISGPDGHLWLFLGNYIYRVDANGNFSAVTGDLGIIGALMFSGTDLLIYNCYDDNNLRVIYGILGKK